MNRSRRLAGLFVAFSLVLLITSCAELIQTLPPSGPPLTTAKDPAIKAAGEASDAVDKDLQAQALVSTAVRTKDLKPLDQAIKLRPTDPLYLMDKLALQVALAQKPDLSLIDAAIGLVASQHPELSATSKVELGYTYFLDALITINKFPKGSPEWTRLHDGYCELLDGYHHQIGNERADVLYSNEGCPAPKPAP